MLKNVRKKISSFPSDSYIKKALSNSILNKIECKIRKLTGNELGYGYYPPVFLFVYRHDINTLKELDSDITLIEKNSSTNSCKNLTKFLKATENKVAPGNAVRIWNSGLFEVFIKSIVLKRFSNNNVRLDKKLPNGRNLDAAIKLNDRWFNLEVTILSSSDNDYNAYGRYIEGIIDNPNEVFIRPGKYDSPNSKSPSPYYDEFRIFRKVYDKITDVNLNSDKSQMSTDEPNVLMLFIGDFISPLQYSRGIGWALDELFADQPKGDKNSFIKWINIEIKRLGLKNEWYVKNLNKVISALSKLSGVIVFDGCNGKIIESRINYNAGIDYKISHREMADIEYIFKNIPHYLSAK